MTPNRPPRATRRRRLSQRILLGVGLAGLLLGLCAGQGLLIAGGLLVTAACLVE